MKIINILIIKLVLIVGFSSCNQNELGELVEIENDPYANINPTNLPFDGYPISSTGYPVLENNNSTQSLGPIFKIHKPVKSDDKTISGTGPIGVPIVLVDVSEIGAILSESVIDKDGNFIFELEHPIIDGHMIGIQLGDLTGTDLDPNDFIYSPNYFDKPLIGILFDTALVNPGK